MCHEAFHFRLPCRTPSLGCRRHGDQPRTSADPAELHRCRAHAPVYAGHEVGAPFNGYRDVAGGWCRNTLDIVIEPLGAVARRQRGAGNVRALAHRQLEQISRVVSPDISPDDHSGGACGCAADTAPEHVTPNAGARAEGNVLFAVNGQTNFRARDERAFNYLRTNFAGEIPRKEFFNSRLISTVHRAPTFRTM